MKRRSALDIVVSVGLWAVCAGACASKSSKLVNGETSYSEPQPDGNTFACATCHALREPAPDGFIRPGHPIGDAARRPSFKNGRAATLLDAVNSCLFEWMGASRWTSETPQWSQLQAFLLAQAPSEPAAPIVITVKPPPLDLAGGDPAVGRSLFNTRCIVCHGQDGTGTRRAPAIIGIGLEPAYAARRIRTSGLEDSPTYDGLTGGRMPFWGADRLSDDELRHLVAYLAPGGGGDAPDTARPPDAGPDLSSAPPDATACASSNSRVGQIAVLTTHFHTVSGTARIVDDCTIVIDQFNYDGNGIDVRAYGAKNAMWKAGFALGGDLRRPSGYMNDTLTLRLPTGRTLDDLDGLSIWCVDAAVSFGDGQFKSP